VLEVLRLNDVQDLQYATDAFCSAGCEEQRSIDFAALVSDDKEFACVAFFEGAASS